jgi:hypothetical protein
MPVRIVLVVRICRIYPHGAFSQGCQMHVIIVLDVRICQIYQPGPCAHAGFYQKIDNFWDFSTWRPRAHAGIYQKLDKSWDFSMFRDFSISWVLPNNPAP